MDQVCQSCEINEALVSESCDDPNNPYLVCRECHDRLTSRALRPREWFNLAKRHGWAKFLLHDDFYDEDGTATQPEKDVVNPKNMPAPTLADAASKTDLLLDYSITRWNLSDELAAAWCSHSKQDIRECLVSRFSDNREIGIRSVILDVAAIALKTAGTDLVRNAWANFPDHVDIWSLVRASAACLPFEEAFSRSTAAIELLPEREQRNARGSLSYFQAQSTLDWIETHAKEPATDDWGYLAAASCLSWSRVVKWLSLGRPLSLIAIDALLAIANPRTPILRTLQPTILESPNDEQFRDALSRYAKTDNAPRVRQRIEAIATYIDKLCSKTS